MAIKLFPRKNGNLRSCTFDVKCGEYAKLSGYGLCPGVCVRINQVHENKCLCEYSEKPYCVAGGQVGLDDSCSDAVIPMPGTYVAYICVSEEAELDDDFRVYADVCTNLENLQAVVTATSGV